MKALLMWGDKVIKTIEAENREPEIKIPIRRVFNVAYKLEPEQAEMDKSNFICFVFRYVDSGRKYLIYELDGFDY